MIRRAVHPRVLPAVLVAVLAVLAAGLVSPASAATKTATIKGVVTLNGAPIPFAKVQIFPYLPDDGADEARVGERLKTDNTDSQGRYSFSGLKATSATHVYAVLVTDRSGRAVTATRDFVVKPGRTYGRNFRMRAAATLTGVIKTSDGRSPAGLTVETDPGNVQDFGPTHDKLYPPFRTTVRADGTFTLGRLDATIYSHLQVSDGSKVKQCYDFVASTLTDCATKSNQPAEYYDRQELTTLPGEQRTLPTVTMTKFAPPVTKVTGLVEDTSGKALKGIEVRLSNDDASATVRTRSSGRYTIEDSLPAGTYTVRFDDPKNVWASQYLGGGPDKSVRQQVTVAPGQPLKGLDTRLKSISTAKIATRGGDGTAKVAFQIKRTATGSAPSGTLTLSFEGVSKTVTVTKGRATVTLSGIRPGTRSLVAVYSGTSSTAGFSKTVKVRVS